ADALDGRADTSDIRRRGRRAADGPARVIRRAGDPEVRWYKGPWPMTVADVCTADTFGSYDTYDEFADRVTRWARSVRDTLHANWPEDRQGHRPPGLHNRASHFRIEFSSLTIPAGRPHAQHPPRYSFSDRVQEEHVRIHQSAKADRRSGRSHNQRQGRDRRSG